MSWCFVRVATFDCGKPAQFGAQVIHCYQQLWSACSLPMSWYHQSIASVRARILDKDTYSCNFYVLINKAEVLHSLISEQSVMETFVQQRNQETLLQINDLRRINGVYARKQR
ncbi:hypothetical protein T06_8328 [Trichinella sp. T6]|nr:hypothetical protein T06_6165 [Trichinella sp. T6]KRX69801.1 hypothetical protein T06_8328 [Trichinella sp. T6]